MIRPAADSQLPVDDGNRTAGASAGIGGPIEPDPQDNSSRIGTSAEKQILVVDDDQATRDWVARTVTRAGFRADTASDGEHGWDALLKAAYDLVITDHEMPRLTGLGLVERIRSFSMEPPCIVISGNHSGIEGILRQLVGPGSILAKPFSQAELIEKVYGHLLHGNITEP
ncbi:MAG TPA: response regulator [Isosphaeraceae bacterium]|nr:response regulator [Isosphaeraceae bacterium]